MVAEAETNRATADPGTPPEPVVAGGRGLTFIPRGVAGHVTSIKVRVPFAVYIDLGEEHK